MNVPAEIVNICILFYSNGCDEFDPDHISPDLILEVNKITKQRVRSTANAFLKRILENGIMNGNLKYQYMDDVVIHWLEFGELEMNHL